MGGRSKKLQFGNRLRQKRKNPSREEGFVDAVQVIGEDASVDIPLMKHLNDITLATSCKFLAVLVGQKPNFPILHFFVLLFFCLSD